MRVCSASLFVYKSMRRFFALKPGRCSSTPAMTAQAYRRPVNLTHPFVRVDFEKDNEPHTRIGAQAGNDRGKGERAAKVELCQQHGGCAVGNKSQESCQGKAAGCFHLKGRWTQNQVPQLR